MKRKKKTYLKKKLLGREKTTREAQNIGQKKNLLEGEKTMEQKHNKKKNTRGKKPKEKKHSKNNSQNEKTFGKKHC